MHFDINFYLIFTQKFGKLYFVFPVMYICTPSPNPAECSPKK